MDNILEIWKPLKNYEKSYYISNLGNIKSLDREIETRFGKKNIKGKILKPFNNTKGYLKVKLNTNKNYYVHRLVAITFIDNPNNLEIVNHIDNDSLNNCVDNLEWVNSRENACHKFIKYKTSSNYIGVSWDTHYEKWNSYITLNKKRYNLGYFINEKDAYQARIDFENKHNIVNKYL